MRVSVIDSTPQTKSKSVYSQTQCMQEGNTRGGIAFSQKHGKQNLALAKLALL